TLLTSEPAASEEDARAAARAAGWTLPRSLAAAACAEEDLARIARGLPADCLAVRLESLGCVLVPDPDGPGRRSALERAPDGVSFCLGRAGRPSETPSSWSLARSTLAAAAGGAVPAEGLVAADEHLGALLLFEGRGLARRMRSRRLAPLSGLTERADER